MSVDEIIEFIESGRHTNKALDDALIDVACEHYVRSRRWKLAKLGPDAAGENASEIYTPAGKLLGDGFSYPPKGAVHKFYHVRSEVLPWGARGFRSDVASAISFVDVMVPGAFWLLGKGRMRATEKLYAFQIMFTSEEVIAEAESNAAVDAILLAALHASKTLTESRAKESAST